MYLTLNGQKIEITPYYFTNNKLLSNTDASQGALFTTYNNAGLLYDVSDIYEDLFLEHKDDSFSWQTSNNAGTYVKEYGGTLYDSEITETISHTPGDDFLHVDLRFVVDNQVLGFDVYYPPYSPYQNKIVFFCIECKNQGYTMQFGVANPNYVPMVDTTGGFNYADWEEIPSPHINYVPHNWSDLSMYPTPNPEIPLTMNFRANVLRKYAVILSDGILRVNDFDVVPLTPDDDTNEPSTNHASYSDISDTIDFSSTPNSGPLDTGFIKAYLPTIQACRELAEFMLTDDFLTNVKKLFLQPIDYIISLHFLPVSPVASTPTTIKIGGVDSEISAPQAVDSYVEFYSGKINLEEFWGSFIDYAPNTSILINIPMIGIRELNVDDVMTGELELKYNINIIDGDFVVELRSNTTHKLNGVINTYQGNMMLSTPVTSTDYGNKIMGGFAAAMQIAGGVATGNVGGAVSGIAGMVEATLQKPQFARSGNVSGGAGFLGNFTPYLIKVRPKQAVPKLYTKLFGKPSMIGGKVNIFKGYTEFKRIDLSGIPCTENEKREIETLMKGGVFV